MDLRTRFPGLVGAVTTSETFQDKISSVLVPVLRPFGLRKVTFVPYEAQIESAWIKLVVALDALRTQELQAWIGSRNEPDDLISVDALEPRFTPGIATNADELESALRRLVDFLTTHQSSLLEGDPVAWADAVDAKQERAAEYTHSVLNTPILARADEAWSRRDFRSVVDLLAPIRGHLDRTHVRRLEYSVGKVEHSEA